MGYIDFDKSELVNLEYSLKKEMLRTSRTGSYSSTTIVGCNTRKYHGLLVSPVDNFDGESYVLLSALDVSIAYRTIRFLISGFISLMGEHYSPKGHKYLNEFVADPVPSMQFEVGTVVVKSGEGYVKQFRPGTDKVYPWSHLVMLASSLSLSCFQKDS